MRNKNNDTTALISNIPNKIVGGFFSALGGLLFTVYGGSILAYWSSFRQLALWIQILLIVCLLLALFVIFLFYKLYAFKKQLKDKEKDSGRLSSIEKAQWPHSILIIDDDEGFLGKIENYLKGKIEPHKMHLVCIKEIPDYRLSSEFEIIISDIHDAGGYGRLAISQLKTIMKEYPYKIVAAATKYPNNDTKSSLEGIKRVFNKNNDDIYREIENFIDNTIVEIEDVHKYWESIECKLRSNRENEIPYFKDCYYDYLERQHIEETSIKRQNSTY